MRLYIDGVRIPESVIRRETEAVERALTCGNRTGSPVYIASNRLFDIVMGCLGAVSCERPILPFRSDSPWTKTDCMSRLHRASDGTWSVAAAYGGHGVDGDTGMMFATSGSTGSAKIVELSTDGLEYQTSTTIERLGISDRDRMLTHLAPSHAYGYSVLRLALTTKAELRYLSRFDVMSTIAEMRSMRCTIFDGLPIMYRALMQRRPSRRNSARLLSQIRVRGCGGDLLPSTLAIDACRHGVPIHDGYGLTEAGPNVAISSPQHFELGTVGPPLPGTDVRISRRETLEVRSPSMMLGYLGESRKTGWLDTGDLAELTVQGNVRILGRRTHRIKISGQSIAPQAIEDRISEFLADEDRVEVRIVGLRKDIGWSDRLVACVRGDLAHLQQQWPAIASQLPPRWVPRRLVPISESRPAPQAS